MVKRCSAKDQAAQRELYTKYAARILTVCRRYCSSNQDAEDTLHDTFLIAFDRISSFRYKGGGSLYAWLCRIATNQAVDRVRKKHWRLVPFKAPAVEDSVELEEEDIQRIQQEKLLAFIAELPDVRRAVFNLYCLDGYSHKEIASMLGISEKGSASILSKAKRQLKNEICKYLNSLNNNEMGEHHTR